MAATKLLVLAIVAGLAYADVYMHNPRGSNNRLDDENRDRDNADRVFDSQNNNRGGYNVGSLYYYAGTTLTVEWTNQHSCGNPNAACEIVVQAMCDDRLRDGTTSDTIPVDPMQCLNWDCDTDVRYGRHESFASYKNCQYRERNKGLFTANQALQGNSAIYTRQNPAGTRRGLECPEERDYYPYWGPTEWRDLAVLTNQPRRCAAYVEASQNKMERWSCSPPQGWVQMRVRAGATGFIPITQAKCELISYTDPTDNVTRNGEWKRTAPWGLADPQCRENAWTRDNHLGNSATGVPNNYNLTVPAGMVHDQCVLRLRYNITTTDLGETPDTANWKAENSIQSSEYTNSSMNQNRQPANQHPAYSDVWTKYRLTLADNAVSFDPNKNGDDTQLKASREYVFKNNPKVNIFGFQASANSLVTNGATVKFQLAINTNQFGRTFQDRSHKFAIKARPEALSSVRVHNLNVGGKRGNIVQTYPGTEYDFQPRRLAVRNGDYVHFQWTGSNTNPNNNAGQGRQGSDRANVNIMRGALYAEGQPITTPPTLGHFGRQYPGRLDAPEKFLGMNVADLKLLALSGPPGGELSELDDAGTYFDLPPRPATRNGIYHYMSTRANNFSNRDHKATMIVSDSTANTQPLGWAGGSVYGANGVFVSAGQGALTQLTIITVENHPPGSSTSIDDVDSDFVDVQPLVFQLAPGATIMVNIPYNRNALGKAYMYRSNTQNGNYNEISDAEFEGGVATAYSTQGGWFVVKTQTNWAAVIGVTLAVILVIAVGSYVLFKHFKNKNGGRTGRV